MPVRPSAARAARWITRDSDLTAEVVEEILWEAAWLLAARSGQFARRESIWADGDPATIECRSASFSPGGAHPLLREGAADRLTE